MLYSTTISHDFLLTLNSGIYIYIYMGHISFSGHIHNEHLMVMCNLFVYNIIYVDI